MDKCFPRVTVWHHSTEPRDANTMTLGTYLPTRTSHSCQILIVPKFYEVYINDDPELTLTQFTKIWRNLQKS